MLRIIQPPPVEEGAGYALRRKRVKVLCGASCCGPCRSPRLAKLSGLSLLEEVLEALARILRGGGLSRAPEESLQLGPGIVLPARGGLGLERRRRQREELAEIAPLFLDDRIGLGLAARVVQCGVVVAALDTGTDVLAAVSALGIARDGLPDRDRGAAMATERHAGSLAPGARAVKATRFARGAMHLLACRHERCRLATGSPFRGHPRAQALPRATRAQGCGTRERSGRIETSGGVPGVRRDAARLSAPG